MAKHPARCPKCGVVVQFDTGADEHLVCPGCQSLLSLPGKFRLSDKVDPLLGQSLGQYEIQELLGRGAMGTVYKGLQASLERFVAIKVLPRAASCDAEFVERFQREARDAAAISHPNIIQIHDVGLDKGYQYIAMEYVEGENLADTLKREGALPPDRAFGLLKQVAAALAAAHAKGVVHRDIKPSNILLTRDDHAKVADFGLAKRGGSDTTLTHSRALVGTPLYFPPEAARGERYDARSDLYSLGATFFHVLAGRPPFEGNDPIALALKHAEQVPPPLKQIAPATPAALCEIIHRLLRKRPDDRYPSASDLLADLNRLADGGAPPHRDVSPADRRQPKTRPRRALVILGAVAAAGLLAAVLLLVLSSSPRASTKPRRPETQTPPVKGPAPFSPAPEVAWKECERKANALIQEQRFGDAVRVYSDLANSFPGLLTRADKANATVKQQAKDVYVEVESRAQKLLADKKFLEARQAIRAVRDRFGLDVQIDAAKALLTDIEAAEKADRATRPDLKPPVKDPTKPDGGNGTKDWVKKQQDAETALDEAEALGAAWDFASAFDVLAEVDLQEVPKPPAGYSEVRELLATRREQWERLKALHDKLIKTINTSETPLKRSDIRIPGLNVDLIKADTEGITATLPKGKIERHPWPSLGPKTVQALVDRAVDKKTRSADEWLAVGLLHLFLPDLLTRIPKQVTPGFDIAAAEEAFTKAKGLGASIDRHTSPLAALRFADVQALLGKADFGEADVRLDRLEEEYGKTPWFATHKKDVDSARGKARAGIAEAKAETLYTRAVKLLEKNELEDLFDLRDLLSKLRADYPETRPVKEAAHKPSLPEMEKAIQGLGKRLSVRQDGKGDFKSTQDAVEAAPPNSMVEVQDNGSYRGPVIIRRDGITLQGKKGMCPTIISSPNDGRELRDGALVLVSAPRATIKNILVVHLAPPKGGTSAAVYGTAHGLSIRSAVILGECAALQLQSSDGRFDSKDSAFLARGQRVMTVSGMQARLTNCLVAATAENATAYFDKGLDAEFCTFNAVIQVPEGIRLVNSIGRRVDMPGGFAGAYTIEYCDLYEPPGGTRPARRGKGCLSTGPKFCDPRKFDYRLAGESPCRGQASDHGDIGCRYTPEMLEMLARARELLKRGIPK